jgi:YVTN family beta-propeller protein
MEPKDESGRRLGFGEFVLDLQNAALTCRGEPIPLSPKEFELLCLLVVHAGRLVEKETLIRSVWPDTFVSDSSLLRTISILRKHLGHESIRTIPKRGYAFVPPVVKLENGEEFHLRPRPTPQDALDQVEPSVDDLSERSSDGEHSNVPTATPGLSGVPSRRTSATSSWRVTAAVIAVVVLVTAAIGFAWLHNRAPWQRTPKSAEELSPEQAAVAGRLLVLNQHANSISVLDTLSKSVESTVPLLSDPRGVAILPDSTSVYVSMNGANSVAVLDVRSGRVLATIPVGRNPVGVVANPRPPFVYVANNYSNTVSVVDSVTRTVVRTLNVGSVPTEIAVAGDGTRAIVTNQSGGSISIIDAVANTVLTTLAVGSTPVGVAFTPDSKFAWVTLAGGNEVAVIDVTTERIVRRIPVGASPVRVTLSRDGARALVSNFLSNTITVVDTASLRPTQKIPVGLNPVGVVFNPVGDLAYVANYGSNSVSVIDTSTMKVLATTQVGRNPVELAVLPCYVVPCGLRWQSAKLQ